MHIVNDLARKNLVLDYIRRNLTLDRILEVENILSGWWGSADLSDPRQYFVSVLMESVYRDH